MGIKILAEKIGKIERRGGGFLEITVKLFANLREGRDKEQKLVLAERQTAKEVIERLAIPVEDVAIIMVNGRRVEVDTLLAPEDVLALFPPVGGG